jgi:hypothetical protein
MDFRPDSEVHSAFERVSRQLDPALTAARPHLLTQGISIHDFSNRSGFDRSGFGHPRWSYDFESRSASESPVSKVSVSITYDEPIFEGERAELQARLTVSVFYLGAATSLFQHQSEPSLSLSEISESALLVWILRALEEGTSQLPEEYRESFAVHAPGREEGSPFG